MLGSTGLLRILDGNHVIGVIAQSPRGYIKLYYTAGEALAYLGLEFSQIGDEKIAFERLAEFQIQDREGFRPDQATDLPGDIIALVLDDKRIRYCGFSADKTFLAKSTDLKETIAAVNNAMKLTPKGHG